MKNTKRLWAFAVIMIISFSLIGCGNEKKNKAIAVLQQVFWLTAQFIK